MGICDYIFSYVIKSTRFRQNFVTKPNPYLAKLCIKVCPV